MKKQLAIYSSFLLLLFFSATELKAQKFDLGVVAGFNSFKFDGAQSWNDKINSGYYFGGALELNFTERLGIQPEVQVQFDRMKNPSNQTVTTQTLNVPILLSWTPVKFLSLQFGPQYSKRLGGWDDIELLDRNFYKKENMTFIGGLQINTAFIKVGARVDKGLMNIGNFDSMDDIRTIGFRVYLFKSLF